MTIDFMVDLAYLYLLRQHYTTDQIRELIKQHGMDELNLLEEEAEALSWEEGHELKDKLNASSFRDFYLWYYFNQVAPPVEKKKAHSFTSESPPIEGKHELLLFVVIKVSAQVDEIPPDEIIDEWQSNCFYELASSERLKVMETDLIGVITERPIL